jgi:hypothetical protein
MPQHDHLAAKRLLAAPFELPPAAAQRLELEPELAPARFRSSGLLGSQLELPRQQGVHLAQHRSLPRC